MTLLIVCNDQSQQQVNLTPAFTTDFSHKAGKRLLTRGEIEAKALATAQSIAENNYKYHILTGIEDDMREVRELQA